MLLLQMQIRRYFNKICDNNVYTVLPRSIAPRFIANLAYRQNSRLPISPIKNTPLYCQTQLPPSATGFQTQKS